MQVLHGMATETMRVSEMAQHVPRRLFNLLKRLSGMQPGRYVIVFNVGPDRDVTWQISELGHIEK